MIIYCFKIKIRVLYIKEETSLNRQQISNSFKRKAIDSIAEKLSKITRRKLTQHENEGNLLVLDIKLISRDKQNSGACCSSSIPK